MGEEFQERVKCYLTGISLEASIRDSFAQLDEHIETWTNPTRKNPYTGEPISESRPYEVEQTQDAGTELLKKVDAALECADGTGDLLFEVQAVGHGMESVNPATNEERLQALRSRLQKANNLLYVKLIEAGL